MNQPIYDPTRPFATPSYSIQNNPERKAKIDILSTEPQTITITNLRTATEIYK